MTVIHDPEIVYCKISSRTMWEDLVVAVMPEEQYWHLTGMPVNERVLQNKILSNQKRKECFIEKN